MKSLKWDRSNDLEGIAMPYSDDKKRREGFVNEQIFVLPKELVRHYSFSKLFSNLHVTDVGFFPHADNHYVSRPRGVDQYILILCTKGKGMVVCQNRKHQLIANTLIIIPHGEPHQYYTDENNPWDIYWAHFAGGLTDEYLILKNNQPYFTDRLTINEIDNIKGRIWQMINIFRNGFSFANVVYVGEIMQLLLTEIFLQNQDREPVDQLYNQLFCRAVKFMYDHLEQKLTLNGLAARLNISVSYLNRLFKQYSSRTPMAYFTQLKMNQAVWYLQYTDDSISDVAERFGYKDVYYFSRMFKQKMGKSPRNYRRNIEELLRKGKIKPPM
ncbi:MAG: AraC family transcriptional regulator [Sporolactobacillus sp.]|jgi:AraC-like DNA-binding protein|nr:AraC family transcriptional regulator [Sporolactobacillus sp.]